MSTWQPKKLTAEQQEAVDTAARLLVRHWPGIEYGEFWTSDSEYEITIQFRPYEKDPDW